MAKYIITWNAGFGESYDLVDCDTVCNAEECARDECMQEVDSNIEYSAMEFTLGNAENYGYESEHPDYVEEDE